MLTSDLTSLVQPLAGREEIGTNCLSIHLSHFFCLCPLGLTIKLDFNMSKVTYFDELKFYDLVRRLTE